MLFNSYIFIFLFLPLAVMGYFLLNKISFKFANCFLILMSLWFYGYFNYKYLIIIIISILVNYVTSRLIIKTKNDVAKCLLIVGVAFNIVLIFYFKYMNFFIANINRVFNVNIITKNILLPLGISFFTFQQISFIVDSYKREVKGINFIEYSMFITFFPQLVVGPILLHSEMIPQFRDKNLRIFNIDNFINGIFLFVLGLCKKVIIADNLNYIVSWLFNNIGSATCMDTIIGMLAFTFQIYFDFSGYSDMAIGISKMFNFYIPANFNSPYKSLSIMDFWKRWHISLTRFLTKYVYIPLGGNRNGVLITYRNILMVFLLSGLWHGANFTFILWGTLHGVFYVLTKNYENIYNKLHYIIRWIITFIFLNFSWLLFRANHISEWKKLCKKIICMNKGLSISSDLLYSFAPAKYLAFLFKLLTNNNYMLISIISIFIVLLYICLFTKNNYNKVHKLSIKNAIIISVLFVLCIISLSNVTKFLYFNF